MVPKQLGNNRLCRMPIILISIMCQTAWSRCI